MPESLSNTSAVIPAKARARMTTHKDTEKDNMNTAKKQQAGLSLIEIMVALVIGSLLLLGAASLLINNKRIYQTQDQLGRMQENARFAVQRMFHDISMAGYFGCTGAAGAITNNLNNSLATGGADYDVSRPVEGFDNATGNWQPSGRTFSPSPARTRAPGTDGITVRGMSGMSYYLDSASPITSQTDDVKVKIPAGIELDKAIEEDDYVMLADCKGADIFQATAVTPDTGNRTLTLEHKTSGDNKTASLHKLYQDYENRDRGTNKKPVARVARLNVNRYYIAPGSKGGTSLYRNNEELVEGVQDMQLLYGIDSATDDNATPDQYVNAAGVGTNWSKIVSVKITLTFEPVDKNFADTADDPEWTYTTTIRIRNNTGTSI